MRANIIQEATIKNTLLGAILIVVSLLFIILAVSSFQDLKKMKSEFSEKSAKVVKENLDLKGSLSSLQEAADQKIDLLAVLEKDKHNFDAQIKTLRDEYKEAAVSYKKEREALKHKIVILKKKIAAMENAPIAPWIKEALGKEENENVKNVLKYALNMIELIKSGKDATVESGPVKQAGPVDEEIPVQETAGGVARQIMVQGPLKEARNGGTVISVDQRNRLISINLGSSDGIKEGDRCQIIKDEQVLGSAEIMGARPRVSAAFIDDLQGKYTMDDIKESSRVQVIKQ